MQRIGVVTFPGFHVMTLAAMSVFELANSELGEHRYDVQFLSENGGRVRSSAGFVIETEPFGNPVFDTVIVGGNIVKQNGKLTYRDLPRRLADLERSSERLHASFRSDASAA